MIPVLDASSGDLGSDVLDAYGTWGFGYLVGHGIPQGLIDEVFAQSRRFHALPLEAKLAIEGDRTDGTELLKLRFVTAGEFDATKLKPLLAGHLNAFKSAFES